MCVLKVQNFPISALAGLYDLQPSVLGGEDLGQIQIGIYPQHFQNILADQIATKLGNTPKAIRMFLCGWVVHFMECISFQLHQIHFQSSSRPQVGPMLTESEYGFC